MGPLTAVTGGEAAVLLSVTRSGAPMNSASRGSPLSKVLLRGTGERWTKGQRSEVRWPGRGPGGQPAGEGAYLLALTAKVSTPQGLTETIPLDYTFHYRPELVAGQ